MNKQRRLEQIKNVIREARNDVSANNASDWAAKLDKAGIVLSIISFVLGVIIAIWGREPFSYYLLHLVC